MITPSICSRLTQSCLQMRCSRNFSGHRTFASVVLANCWKSERFLACHPWGAVLDGAVNKRDLSTGETGEFASENLGVDSNPGVVCATPQDLASNWREGAARKNLRNVWDTGGKSKNAAVNETRPRSWGGDGLAPLRGQLSNFSDGCVGT